MDKGIFYLICSLIIVGVVIISNGAVAKQVSNTCAPKVVESVTPEPSVSVEPSVVTPVVSASPAAGFRVKSATVAPVTKAVK